MKAPIRLHPKVAKLVRDEVERQRKLPRTKAQIAKQSKPITANQLANEILWLALRTGDIRNHYTDRKLARKLKQAHDKAWAKAWEEHEKNLI